MRRLHLPQRTVRLRLALLYGLLFLASGAALLGVTYLLMRGTSGAIAAHPIALGQTPVPQAIASNQQATDLHRLLFWSAVTLAVMAIASVGLGWVVAGRILARLRAVTAAAQTISASNLHERLAFEGPDDELKELGDTFDGLLGRLESSFQAQRQFVANASHELRTPLTLSRALLQVALADPTFRLNLCESPAGRCSKPRWSRRTCSRRSSPSATAKPDSSSGNHLTLPRSPKKSFSSTKVRRKSVASRSARTSHLRRPQATHVWSNA